MAQPPLVEQLIQNRGCGHAFADPIGVGKYPARLLNEPPTIGQKRSRVSGLIVENRAHGGS
jgi:hypothetical protein